MTDDLDLVMLDAMPFNEAVQLVVEYASSLSDERYCILINSLGLARDLRGFLLFVPAKKG